MEMADDLVKALEPKTIKLMVVGDRSVGKSCLIHQFVDGTYVEDHPPSEWKREQRFQRKHHSIIVDGKPIKLELMELNDDLFRLTDVCTEAIYPDAMIADCYIYLFNLADPATLHSVGNWKQEMERYNVGPQRRHAVWSMAGHKIVADHDYKGMTSQAETKAAAMKMKFFSVNARDGENVEQCFMTLVADTLENQKKHEGETIDPWATPTSTDQHQPVFKIPQDISPLTEKAE